MPVPVPMDAFCGEESTRLTVSLGSPVVSPRTGTVKVALVWPAGKETVPEPAV